MYSRRTKPRHSVQWRVKTGVPGSMVGTRQSMETEIVKFVSVADGFDKASRSLGCSTDGEASQVVSLVTSLTSAMVEGTHGVFFR